VFFEGGGVPLANKSLFSSSKSKLPRATARNEAGGPAYSLAPKQALAQLAATGTFGNTFYTTAETQLDELRQADRPGRRQRLLGEVGGLRA
jgi:hypothetical protein